MIIRLLSHQSLADLLWLGFLIGLFLYFWRKRQALLRAQAWPKTEGMISVYILTEDHGRVWPKIEYEYKVEGQSYQGEDLLLDTQHHLPTSNYAKKIAYQAAIAYQNQQAIEVYYNPQDPGQSALDVKVPGKFNLLLGIVVFLLFLQIFFLIFLR